jgi:hypothetical protein
MRGFVGEVGESLGERMYRWKMLSIRILRVVTYIMFFTPS